MKPFRIALPRLRAYLLFLLVFFPAALMFGDQGDPPARVARISYMSGSVSLEPAGENQWSQASLNYPLTTNDRLYTRQGARAELDLGTAAVRMGETTDLTVANLTDTFLQLGLAQGTIEVSVYELPPGNSVEVDTPNGALTIQHEGYYRVEAFPSTNTTLLSVYRGRVQLSGGGLSQTVSAGQAVKLTGTSPIQATYSSLPPRDTFDQWCAQRDRRFMSAASARYVSRAVPGYEDLDAYGVWSEVPPYGPVWYPSGVVVGWVPYRFGRWVWVMPWGWTWVEVEPWGFAPFHYGRWVYIGLRWGWVPGPIVPLPYYAPALVAFVGGPGFSVAVGVGPAVAWFPLGPFDPFFPWYHYGPAYLRIVNVTNVRSVTVVNLVHVTDIRSVHYAYERTAVTAVSRSVFRSGQLIGNHIVRLNAQQLARAQIIPHPSVNPTMAAAMAGRVVRAPIRTPRFAAIRTFASRPLATRYAPPSAGRLGGVPSVTRPRLITRTPVPPRSVPFQKMLRAMASHPGRPLEPQQLSNLRFGRPAGPMLDREFPPHPEFRGGGRFALPRGGGRHP